MACPFCSMNIPHDASEAGVAAGVKRAFKMVRPDQAGRLWPPCGPLHYASALKSTQPEVCGAGAASANAMQLAALLGH